MTTYIGSEHIIKRTQRARVVLEGIPYLTLADMLVLMGADPAFCDEEDQAAAKSDLRACGYADRHISRFGSRAIFPRWVKIAREDAWFAEHLPGQDWRPSELRRPRL